MAVLLQECTTSLSGTDAKQLPSKLTIPRSKMDRESEGGVRRTFSASSIPAALTIRCATLETLEALCSTPAAQIRSSHESESSSPCPPHFIALSMTRSTQVVRSQAAEEAPSVRKKRCESNQDMMSLSCVRTLLFGWFSPVTVYSSSGWGPQGSLGTPHEGLKHGRRHGEGLRGGAPPAEHLTQHRERHASCQPYTRLALIDQLLEGLIHARGEPEDELRGGE